MENQQENFKFIESFMGEINYTPAEEFGTTDNRLTSLSEAGGTQTEYLWWLALVYVSCMPTPLSSRSSTQAFPRLLIVTETSPLCFQTFCLDHRYYYADNMRSDYVGFFFHRTRHGSFFFAC